MTQRFFPATVVGILLLSGLNQGNVLGQDPDTNAEDIRLVCEWMLFEAWFDAEIIPPVLAASELFRERKDYESFEEMAADWETKCEKNRNALIDAETKIVKRRSTTTSSRIVSFCNAELAVIHEAKSIIDGWSGILGAAGGDATKFEQSGKKWIELVAAFWEKNSQMSDEYYRLVEEVHRTAERVLSKLG